MKNALHAVIQAINRFGNIHKIAETNNQRGTYIAWSLSCIIAPAVWCLTIVYIFSGYWPKVLLGAGISTMLSAPLFMIRYGHYRAARIHIFLQYVLFSFLMPFVVGTDARTEWVVILTPSLAYLLFDRELHFPFLVIGIGGFVTVMAIYQWHQPLMPSTYPLTYRFFLASAICVFVYWLIVLFKKETIRSEAVIKNQNAMLLENQDAIAWQNTELLEANAELDRQRASLQNLNTELKHFAHVASHDLKEPLRNISAFATLLSRRIGDDPRHQELLQFIESGAKRMARLLDDLTAYSKVGLEKMPRETVSLNDTLLIVRQNLSIQLESTGGEIQSANLPKLFAHRTLMTQLFQNLCGNGLKYRRPGLAPLVQVRYLKKDNNALFVVRDNGIGIAPENLQRIFEPFQRLHAQNEIEGSGIGLATCRKIADLYCGKIWAESVLGEGTTVCIELPGDMVLESTAAAPLETSTFAATAMA